MSVCTVDRDTVRLSDDPHEEQSASEKEAKVCVCVCVVIILSVNVLWTSRCACLHCTMNTTHVQLSAVVTEVLLSCMLIKLTTLAVQVSEHAQFFLLARPTVIPAKSDLEHLMHWQCLDLGVK